jgi:hypothetical protein
MRTSVLLTVVAAAFFIFGIFTYEYFDFGWIFLFSAGFFGVLAFAFWRIEE